MAITEERSGPSKEPTPTRNPDNRPSAQNGASQPDCGLPGLAGFGQMQGYQPIGSQAQEAARQPEAQSQPEPVPELVPADPVVPHDPIPDQGYSFDPQSGDSHLSAEIDPFAPETDHPAPDYFAGTAAAGDDSASLMDDIQSLMNEPNAFDDAQLQPESDIFEPAPPHQAEVLDPAPASAAPHREEVSEPGARSGEGGALQTFEAGYDQHPEIPLGAFEQHDEAQPQVDEPQPHIGEPQPEEQPYFDHYPGQPQADADFLSGEVSPQEAQPKPNRGRKILMAASGLVGVLALGGALAFAYKIGGDSDIAMTDKPPLIQADSRPVKVAPDKPGGKEFPHANKKIYERLGGDEGEEVVKIKPRQEDIASAATAAINPPGEGQQQNAAEPGGPRKVKTLTVRPDGTIEAANPQAPSAAPPGAVTAPDGTVAMRFPRAASPEPAQAQAPDQPVAPQVPAAPEAAPPAAEAAPQQQAALAPATVSPPIQKPKAPSAPAAQPAAASGTGNYVVQVAARKSQTDALAAFADIQQKYPSLLSGYRPIIQRADLGEKGVWYRLNVGPVKSKQVASTLCGQLKSAGMRSCLVRAQ